jgi:hypothetical protein
MPAVVENANCAVIAKNNNFDQVDRLMHLHIQSKHAVALTGVSTSRSADQLSVEGAAWFSMGT